MGKSAWNFVIALFFPSAIQIIPVGRRTQKDTAILSPVRAFKVRHREGREAHLDAAFRVPYRGQKESSSARTGGVITTRAASSAQGASKARQIRRFQCGPMCLPCTMDGRLVGRAGLTGRRRQHDPPVARRAAIGRWFLLNFLPAHLYNVSFHTIPKKDSFPLVRPLSETESPARMIFRCRPSLVGVVYLAVADFATNGDSARKLSRESHRFAAVSGVPGYGTKRRECTSVDGGF